jgi:hypothetical protein
MMAEKRDFSHLVDSAAAAFEDIEGQQLTYEIRKPDKEWHVRTHPDDSYWGSAWLVEMKKEPFRGFWLPEKSLHSRLDGEPCFKRSMLILTVTSEGLLFFWPIPAPTSDFTRSTSQAQLTAARAARENWQRILWNGNAHVAKEIQASHREPAWPEESFVELLNRAFEGRDIQDGDHDVIRQLGV